MAVPISLRFNSTQEGIAVYMTGVCFAAIADKHDVSFVSGVAVVADPIHIFLFTARVLELTRLYFELFTLVPEVSELGSAVGAAVGGVQPFLQTVEAEFVFALEPALIFDLIEADGAFVFFEFFEFFESFSLTGVFAFEGALI